MRNAVLSMSLVAFTLLASAPADAQQEAATIVGVVTDASHGVIPGAVVTVTNVATGISTTSKTNDRGLYSVPGLRPGEYVVTIEIQGFSRFVRSGHHTAGCASAPARC
jgi:hypothetical protein